MSLSLQSNLAIVEAHDRARSIATLFAPEQSRSDLITLYAFDAEVSRISDVVSDPLPGEIRLQWWREVIDGERAGEAKGNALAHDILGVIDRHALPRAAFDAYFEAKTFEFYNDAFPDTTALEAYCGETSSAILQLASLILDGSAAKACADISGHGGVALGIARIIERLARTRSKGQCYLPQDLMSACGLSRDDFVAGENKAAIKHATDGLSALGISHYEKWRALMKAAPKSVKPAFLPVAAARHLLVKAQKSAHAPAFQLVQISAMRRLLAITKAALI